MTQKIIGVTGIPGSGKTEVANLLVQKGMTLIDVDEAGRWAVESSRTVRNQLMATFGKDFFANGRLERKKLGERVFADEAALQKLNNIVHPFMLERVNALIRRAKRSSRNQHLVIDAALLFELELAKRCDLVLCVWAPIKTCLLRSMQRDGLSQKHAQQRLRSQLPQEEKLRLAGYAIENSGSLLQLKAEVDKFYAEMLV